MSSDDMASHCFPQWLKEVLTMLMRTLPITRMPRLCNRLSRVAITGLAFTILSPLPLIAADDDEQGSVQTEEKPEDKRETSHEEKDKQNDSKSETKSKSKAKHEKEKHHGADTGSGDSHEKTEKISGDANKKQAMADEVCPPRLWRIGCARRDCRFMSWATQSA
jgi:hypothetical protein